MPRFGPHALEKYCAWEGVRDSLGVAKLSRTTKTSGVPEVSAAEYKKRSDDAKMVLDEIQEALEKPLSVRDFNMAQDLRGQLNELLGLNKLNQATPAETPSDA